MSPIPPDSKSAEPKGFDFSIFPVIFAPIALFGAGLIFQINVFLTLSPVVAFFCAIMGASTLGRNRGAAFRFVAFFTLIAGYLVVAYAIVAYFLRGL